MSILFETLHRINMTIQKKQNEIKELENTKEKLLEEDRKSFAKLHEKYVKKFGELIVDE